MWFCCGSSFVVISFGVFWHLCASCGTPVKTKTTKIQYYEALALPTSHPGLGFFHIKPNNNVIRLLLGNLVNSRFKIKMLVALTNPKPISDEH